MYRASGCAPLFTGTDGLTEVQEKRLNELNERHKEFEETGDKKKKLSDIMINERANLIVKQSNFLAGIVELGEGAKTFVRKIVRKEFYNYKRESFKGNATTEKGTVVEQDSIDFLNIVLLKGWRKATESDWFGELAYNYMTGHPDIVDEDEKEVIDIKSPWSKATFPDFPSDSECELYNWQIRAYLYMLNGMTQTSDWKKGRVIHVLVDTPEELIYDDEPDDLHDMSDVPDHLRYTIVEVELTDAHIAHMNRRIEAANKYADEYRQLLLNKNK